MPCCWHLLLLLLSHVPKKKPSKSQIRELYAFLAQVPDATNLLERIPATLFEDSPATVDGESSKSVAQDMIKQVSAPRGRARAPSEWQQRAWDFPCVREGATASLSLTKIRGRGLYLFTIQRFVKVTRMSFSGK